MLGMHHHWNLKWFWWWCFVLTMIREMHQMDDRREAIPSWNGYVYQGEIALVVLVEKMLELEKSDLPLYSIGLEDVEDFSIYCQQKIVSIHQVKAVDKNRLSEYGEALYKLAGSLSIMEDDVKGYLHVTNKLDADSVSDIEKVINQYENAQINKWEQILLDEEKFKREYEVLVKGITKNNKIDQRVNNESKEILEYAMPLENKESFSEEIARECIAKYICKMSKSIFSKEVLKRISIYKYANEQKYIDSNNVMNYLESLLERIWNCLEIVGHDGSEEQYGRLLQEKITKYVHERYANAMLRRDIAFHEFSETLEGKLPTNGEQRLMMQKDVLINQGKMFCDKCGKEQEDCLNCDVQKMLMWMTSSNVEEKENTSEFRYKAYMLSPNIQQNILDDAVYLFNLDGLKKSTFLVLEKLFNQAELKDYIITYRFDDIYYMLTDIFCSDRDEETDAMEEIYTGLTNNETVEDICCQIDRNREIAVQRMEIDAMIIGGIEIEIDDIDNHVGRITNVKFGRDKEPSYTKITHKKKLSLIPAKSLIEKYGGNRHA